MGTYDKGMRLSAGGLSITAQQVVKLGDDRLGGIIFALNDGDITSYMYDPLSDTGFIQTELSTNIKAYADSIPETNGYDIVEIAGGEALKLRYNNGACVTIYILGEDNFKHILRKNVARVTRHNYYFIGDGATQDTYIPYYKSGSGTAQLVPMMSTMYSMTNNIVAVFEDDYKDHIVTIDDVGDQPIIGFVGEYRVVGDGTSKSLVTPNGSIGIDGFGTIYRDTAAVSDIIISGRVAPGAPIEVDHSGKFSPVHYDYIQQHRDDWKNGWHGTGKLGYIVDIGDYVNMKVPCPMPTPELNDIILFVIVDGVMKKVNYDGTFTDINTINLTGSALINYIYNNDMSQTLVIGSFEEVEPFCVNGYSFGYPSGRWVDAELEEM